MVYVLLDRNSDAESEFAAARTAMIPYFSDSTIDSFVALDRLRAASYSKQWGTVISGWPQLPGDMKQANGFFAGRAIQMGNCRAATEGADSV